MILIFLLQQKSNTAELVMYKIELLANWINTEASTRLSFKTDARKSRSNNYFAWLFTLLA